MICIKVPKHKKNNQNLKFGLLGFSSPAFAKL